jgi:hypothetical protein
MNEGRSYVTAYAVYVRMRGSNSKFHCGDAATLREADDFVSRLNAHYSQRIYSYDRFHLYEGEKLDALHS